MKRLLATAVVTVLTGAAVAGGAFAQTAAPAANPNASTPAVASPKANNPGAPAAGANSFTEAQAKSRIEGAGYSNVSGLIKDKDGIWKGKASKGGATVDVGLDYQGNVVGSK
jgi:opacity protein-like surface antigen